MIKNFNNFLRFVINLIFFIAIVVVIDQAVGRMLETYYFSSKSGTDYLTNYSIDSTKADIIILGSSRASHHYIPKIFEDSLKMSCFNTGRDGNFIFYQYAIFSSIINRYKPKLVIMDINPDEIYYETKSYDGLATLLPYYSKNNAIRNIVDLKSDFEKYKTMSKIYPFNSTIVSVFNNHHNFDNRQILDEGYIPLNGQLVDFVLQKNKVADELSIIDTNKINALNSISEQCNKNKIKLIFIQSPRYSIVSQNKSIVVLSNISKKNGVEFWNFVNDTSFINHTNYFKDPPHLNKEGAVLFTKKVIANLNDRKILDKVMGVK